MIGKVVEKESHRLVHFRCSDGVVVVEHQDPLLLRRIFTGAGDVVDERSHGDGGRGGVQGLEDCRIDVEANALEGSHQVGQEARQVVVAVVEGEPPDSGACLALIKVGEPVADHSGLPEPSRCGHQSKTVARIEGGVELLGKSGARDKLRAPGRRKQLGSEHLSRHPRIIE